MSLFRRFWQRISRPTYFVGRDLEDNKFYEYPSVTEDPRRTKRVVKYKHGQDMLDYVAGGKRLAVQWISWLTHTRIHPPTMEELHADLERQRRVIFRASMIEARDREERAKQQQIAASQNAPRHAVDAPQTQPAPVPPHPETASGDAAGDARETQRSAPEHTVPASDEPQAWNPRTIRRGS